MKLRRLIALALSLLMLLSCAAAGAESFRIAGYDPQSSGHDWNNNLFFVRMEEKTGLSLRLQQFTERAAYDAWLGGLTAEGELPDALFKASLNSPDILRLYEAGVLIDLRPFLQDNAPNLCALLAAHPDWEAAITLPDGAIPALPQFNDLPTNNALWINTSWLAVLGLDMPVDAASFAELLRAFKTRDPNRNGQTDETPLAFTSLFDLRFLGHAFGLVSNDYYLALDADGTVRSTVTCDENRAFLEWLHGLWAEGLLDRFGFGASETSRAVSDSKAAIPYGCVFGPSIMPLLSSEQVTHYAVMPPLAFEGRQVYRALQSQVQRGCFAITSACADPAALLRWVDFLYTEEGCYLASAGLQDVDYERHSDGTWSWIVPLDQVAETVLVTSTISEGAVSPGYVPLSYQTSYDEASTHHAVQNLAALQTFAVSPMPPLWLTAEEADRIAALWAKLGPYCEQQMVWFVTGDVPLNDETWAAFKARAEELGLAEFVRLWQEALR